MTIKHFISAFIVALFLLSSQLKAQTVYVTDNGKKYHAKNCDLVKTGKKGIELAEAKKKGYEPCKICKVEATEPKSTQKTGSKSKK